MNTKQSISRFLILSNPLTWIWVILYFFWIGILKLNGKNKA